MPGDSMVKDLAETQKKNKKKTLRVAIAFPYPTGEKIRVHN